VRIPSWLTPAPPTVAIEMASRRVTVAAVSGTSGRLAVTGQASEPLVPGLIAPALVGTNIPDPEAVAAALGRAFASAGLADPGRAALVVPDSAAPVSLVTLEQVPSRAADLDQLLRLQIRKSTPFPLDAAQISHVVVARAAGGTTFAVVVARRDVIAEYEGVAARLGIHTGLVDLASFNVMNAIIGAGVSGTGDWLLVHLASEATTLAIVRGDALMFYRHRTAVDEEPLGALVHQTAMYHEDRLGGGGFARAWISGAGRAGEDARAQLRDRLGIPVETVDVRPAADLRTSASAGATVDYLDAMAASVGVLLRDRAA
jgi:Tfp pilus assembly PilM family ATPase